MDDITLIKQRVNIVELLQEYLPLKKSGINFKANCPFHQEKTPSFVVSPERGIWKCFGCDKSGDHFKFLMEKEGIEFVDALEILAQRAGVELKKKKEKSDPGARLILANQKAQQFFHYLLISHKLGQKALGYLKKRGLTDDTIKDFGLGYAPQNWEELTKFLIKRGFTKQELITSGLCVPSKSGCYDRFRGRIMFSLFDVRDRVIGFSGRSLEDGKDVGPKYINTPQTSIFDKSRFFFGLNLSKTAIKEKQEAVLVEGEMDMILSFQSGVKNVVATKGTALTESQIEIISRYANTVALCFDTDFAGDFAARRGIEMVDSAGLNIKVIKIRDAKDPAELCFKNPDEWNESVKSAEPIYDYYLQSVSGRYDLKKAAGKKAVFFELLPIWRKITDPIVKDHYIQKLAALLQVKEQTIKTEIDRGFYKKPSVLINQEKIDIKQTVPDRRRLLEEYLISLILHLPANHVYVPSFPETIFTLDELKQIYVLLVLFLDSISFRGDSFKISSFIETVPQELIEIVDRLYLIEIDDKLIDSKHWIREVNSVVLELKRMLIKTSLEKLSLQIKNAQEFDKVEILEVLNKRFRDLSVKLKNL